MKILFLINAARRDEKPQDALIAQFREILDASSFEYALVESGSMEESHREIARALAEGFDAIWIGGGDGTINAVLNQTFGHEIAYAIIPMGTVNALARALHIPLDPVEAVRYHLGSMPVPMDVGHVAHRYFLLYSTVGIHAAVFANVDNELKKRWGQIAFWESAVRTLWHKSRLPRFIMEMKQVNGPDNDEVVRDFGYAFTLSNVANYAGFGTFTDNDAAAPGAFAIHSFRRNHVIPMLLRYALLWTIGRPPNHQAGTSIYRLVRWLRVRSNHRLSVQVDGEPIQPDNARQLEFQCIPNAIRIMLGPDEAEKLTGSRSRDDG